MNVLIVTPANQELNSGNQITAKRLARIFRDEGHHVKVVEAFSATVKARSPFTPDIMVALHARKSARSIFAFKKCYPAGRIIVVLTGTDLHQDLLKSAIANKTIQLADDLVILESHSRSKLPDDVQFKTHPILQSAVSVSNPPKPLKNIFEVAVVGHMRPVKDPFRAAVATHYLPDDSKIRVVQIGAALSDSIRARAMKLQAANPRYQWVGAAGHAETQKRIARARLLVLTSKNEGGPSVIAEAIVSDTPVLTTRISATIGMLGEDYPGMFAVGDTQGLAKLMSRAETDGHWYNLLESTCRKLKPKFAIKREVACWRKLLKG